MKGLDMNNAEASTLGQGGICRGPKTKTRQLNSPAYAWIFCASGKACIHHKDGRKFSSIQCSDESHMITEKELKKDQV
jgi:hypothetical protein